MRTLLPLLALLLVAGCDASGFDERERAELLTGDVQITLGETETLDGLELRFDAVTEDSRCPLDAVCIWAGLAAVALTIDGEDIELSVVDPDHTPESGVRIGDVTVFAVGLAPLPRLGDPSAETPVVSVSTVAAD